LNLIGAVVAFSFEVGSRTFEIILLSFVVDSFFLWEKEKFKKYFVCFYYYMNCSSIISVRFFGTGASLCV
jgi:hypothetical protein